MAAESLDDGEFWLPPKFLTDNDNIFTETAKTKTPSGLKNTKDLFGFDAPLFPLEFPYGFDSFRGGVGLAGGDGFSSDLSSPVESVVGSTTEPESSDEEDYLAGLTRQMGHSTLEDLDFLRNDKSFTTENTNGRFVSGSPQSTLCSVGSGCRCGQGSSHGSLNLRRRRFCTSGDLGSAVCGCRGGSQDEKRRGAILFTYDTFGTSTNGVTIPSLSVDVTHHVD